MTLPICGKSLTKATVTKSFTTCRALSHGMLPPQVLWTENFDNSLNLSSLDKWRLLRPNWGLRDPIWWPATRSFNYFILDILCHLLNPQLHQGYNHIKAKFKGTTPWITGRPGCCRSPSSWGYSMGWTESSCIRRCSLPCSFSAKLWLQPPARLWRESVSSVSKKKSLVKPLHLI